MKKIYIEKAKFLRSKYAKKTIGISSCSKIDEMVTDLSFKSGIPKSIIFEAAILNFLENDEHEAEDIYEKQMSYINFLIFEKNMQRILIKDLRDSGMFSGRIPGHIKNHLFLNGYVEKIIKPKEHGGKASFRAYVKQNF